MTEYDEMSTAVVVVDMQNDFCHPDGALYAEGSEAAIAGVNDVIYQTRCDIFYTLDTHQPNDPEFERWGPHCLEGSWGHEIHDDVITAIPHQVVEKNTYDAFHGTSFHEMLQQSDIDTLIICGTLANVCVQETASSANLLGYDVYVVSDAVGYIAESDADSALDHIDFLIGETIKSVEL